MLEGLKRKVVWRVLGRMGLAVNGPAAGAGAGAGTGAVGVEPEERVLVGVRHW